MPAKKATPAPQRASSSNSGWAMWVYLIGVIVAGLLGAFGKALNLGDQIIMYLSWLLILAGILAGIFFLDSGDVVNFGIRVLLLFAVKGALDQVPAVGLYISGFFNGVYGFFLPVGLTLLVMYFWKKYFGSMM